MGNRRSGVYDPGCVDGQLQEADIVLQWALALEAACKDRGLDCYLTRRDRKRVTPVSARAGDARMNHCTHLISIHVNDADRASAHGIETLYNKHEDFARLIHTQVVGVLKGRDRGLKLRTDLAVLKFGGPCCLIELGFIKNPEDVKAFMDLTNVETTCERLVQVMLHG